MSKSWNSLVKHIEHLHSISGDMIVSVNLHGIAHQLKSGSSLTCTDDKVIADIGNCSATIITKDELTECKTVSAADKEVKKLLAEKLTIMTHVNVANVLSKPPTPPQEMQLACPNCDTLVETGCGYLNECPECYMDAAVRWSLYDGWKIVCTEK